MINKAIFYDQLDVSLFLSFHTTQKYKEKTPNPVFLVLLCCMYVFRYQRVWAEYNVWSSLCEHPGQLLLYL